MLPFVRRRRRYPYGYRSCFLLLSSPWCWLFDGSCCGSPIPSCSVTAISLCPSQSHRCCSCWPHSLAAKRQSSSPLHSIRSRRSTGASSKRPRTRYSLDDQVCPPLDRDLLRSTVEKHCRTLDSYLANKPIAQHTIEAFAHVRSSILQNNANNASTTPIILDSGCGTGRSSLLLGEMYPSHTVVGIDRSIKRLWSNVKFRKGGQERFQHRQQQQNNLRAVDMTETNEHCNNNKKHHTRTQDEAIQIPLVQHAAPNVLLVRAELVDFWRLILLDQEAGAQNDGYLNNDHVGDDNLDNNATATTTTNSNRNHMEWNITHHFLLYPNPYPKRSRFKHRWYAHPSFPILLQLGAADSITIRSNWKGYLDEFRDSVLYSHDYWMTRNANIAKASEDTDCTSVDVDPQQQQQQQQQQKLTNDALPFVESARRRGPILRDEMSKAWTNFEAKYDAIGEPTYELKLDSKHYERDRAGERERFFVDRVAPSIDEKLTVCKSEKPRTD